MKPKCITKVVKKSKKTYDFLLSLIDKLVFISKDVK